MSGRLRVVIAGAGVFGLGTALALLDSDTEVLLLDPHSGVPNASAVAAGLLAPVGEVIFDPDVAAHYPLMVDALGLWPGFAQRAGLRISDDGLVVPRSAQQTLVRLGCAFDARGDELYLQADPRVVDPASALLSLRRAVEAGGCRIETRHVAEADWRTADLLVLATGDGMVERLDPPELQRLTPVKGQIAVLPMGPVSGPTVRWPGGYLAPQPGGARIGATMEVGRRDTVVEPAVVSHLISAAARHAPGIDARGAFGQAGVRMQTPDALPLVGPSALSRTLLATGARRNGWLFAPLVGRIIAAYCKGEDPGPWASALHPERFDAG